MVLFCFSPLVLFVGVSPVLGTSRALVSDAPPLGDDIRGHPGPALPPRAPFPRLGCLWGRMVADCTDVHPPCPLPCWLVPAGVGLVTLSCLRSRWPPSGRVSPFLVPVYVSLPLSGRGPSRFCLDVPLALFPTGPVACRCGLGPAWAPRFAGPRCRVGLYPFRGFRLRRE